MPFGSKHPAEEDIFSFTFATRLGAGETIVSAPWTCEAYEGIDAAASSMVSGPATVSGPLVNQKIIGGLENVQYVLGCLALTSAGRKIYRWDTLWVRRRPVGEE